MNNLKFYIYTPLDKFVVLNGNDLVVISFDRKEIRIRYHKELIEVNIAEILQQRPGIRPMVEVSMLEFRTEFLKHEALTKSLIGLNDLIESLYRKSKPNNGNSNLQ